MSLSVSAFAAYAVTLLISLASAVAHPWFDAEARFVNALTSMNEATSALLKVTESP